MDRTLTYTVSIEESDLRADQFLSRRGFSSHILTRLRKNMEHLLINGTPSRTNTPLHEGDILTVHIVEEHSSYHVPPVKLPLSIVYEDEDILVANKPAKMPIHPSMDNYYNSLANALAWYYRDSGNFIFRCTNRLDRDTSGLTVIAKNMLSSAILSDMAVRHAITREYLAIVRGVVTPASGTITAPLSRKPGSIIERCVDFEHGERAVVGGAGGGADPPGHLPLDHHRHRLKALGLEQGCDHRGCDIVGQVGTGHHRQAGHPLPAEGGNVRL